MTSRSRAYLLSLFCCRLIIIILNPNPSPSLSTHSSYNKYKEQIWILVFPNARTAGSGNTPLSLTKPRAFNMSNAIVYTRLSTTTTSLSVVKQTSKLTPYDLKLNRTNCALTHSNVWIAKPITKLTQINALSGNTNSTKSVILRNTTNSRKLGTS